MKKYHMIVLVIAIALIVGIVSADQMIFSTYYPAPYGRYRQFSTTGLTTLATDEFGNEGATALVGIGTTDPKHALHINETENANPILSPGVYIEDNRPYNTVGTGGSIHFGGKYTSAGDYTGFAGIRGVKANTADGDFDGKLEFFTRKHNDSVWTGDQRMVIDENGKVGIGTTRPFTKLNIEGNVLIGEQPSGADLAGLPFFLGTGRNVIWLGAYDGTLANDYGVIYGEQTGFVYRLNILTGDDRKESGLFDDEIFIGNVDHVTADKEGLIVRHGNVGIGATAPTLTANPYGNTRGNLEVGDVWLRDANGGSGAWASAGAGIQAGVTSTLSFARTGQAGDWQSDSITFPQAFASTPKVFLCGVDVGVAVVWHAKDITATGFTASGRNSDLNPGTAAAQWLAVAP